MVDEEIKKRSDILVGIYKLNIYQQNSTIYLLFYLYKF